MEITLESAIIVAIQDLSTIVNVFDAESPILDFIALGTRIYDILNLESSITPISTVIQ